MLGSTTPRLFTPPLRRLTPATSVGFRQIEWARDELGRPLDPWEEFAVIHAGELRRDGRLRFRKVFVIVARQNGKTEICVVLGGYWLLADVPGLTLGTSTKLDYARESFNKLRRHIRRSPALLARMPAPRWYREANGEQEIWQEDEFGDPAWRYKIGAANSEGGRSLTLRRLILDELRQHHTYEAWDASVPAMIAEEDAQAWALSNAGDDRSVVLNEARDAAVGVREDGTEYAFADRDTDTLWMEWSARPDADPEDELELAQANPNMNRRGPEGKMRVDGAALLAAGRAAKRTGGAKLTGFKTEHMCIRVVHLDPALDAEAWARGHVPGDLAAFRSRVGMVLDVSPDLQHVALYAAAMVDARGRIRVDHVADWSGAGAVRAAARDMPAWLTRVAPRRFGWFAGGPGAALSADLEAIRDGTGPRPRPWPASVEFVPITDAPGVCMGFAAAVAGDEILHVPDPLLDGQAGPAEWLVMGDRKVFSRRGGGHVDAVYAAAGAADLARTMPPPVGELRLITAED